MEDAREYVKNTLSKTKSGIAFFKHGVQVMPFTSSALDSSMAALRAQQIDEAARIWGVPKPLLGAEKSGTSQAALIQEFWRNCVKDHTNALLAAMTMKLLPSRGEGSDHRFAVDPSEMFRGDPELFVKMLPALGDAQRPGVISPTEARRLGSFPATMPEETETDKRVMNDLEKRQAGLPKGGDQGRPPAEISSSKEMNDDKDDDS